LIDRWSLTAMTPHPVARRLLAVTCCVALAAWAGGASPAKSSTMNDLGAVKVGKPCPTFAGFTVENSQYSLREALTPPKGERAVPVIISVFATWCEPCKRRLPDVQAVATALGDKKVRVVLVGEDTEGAAKIKPFLEEHQLALPTLADPYGKIAERLGLADKGADRTSLQLPRTFVVDGDGLVRTIFDVEGEDFREALTKAVTDASKAARKP
jgi:peroxiredoxin